VRGYRRSQLGTKAADSEVMQPTTDRPSHGAHSPDLRRTLHEDHERLDKLFADLLAAFQADAREDAACLWSAFDRGLRTHMELEERDLFPAFTTVNAPEAAALLREHDRIRQRLLDLGIGVDLHLTRDYQVEEFVRDLRAHAAREDALLYQWAQRELHPTVRASLRQRLADLRSAKHDQHTRKADGP
jgi:hemerythrin-like domain-containing protein